MGTDSPMTENEAEMSANRKIILSFVSGSLIWFVVLCLMPAAQSVTIACVSNYLALTVGLAIGGCGNSLIRRRPWLLLFVPSMPLVLGIFV